MTSLPSPPLIILFLFPPPSFFCRFLKSCYCFGSFSYGLPPRHHRLSLFSSSFAFFVDYFFFILLSLVSFFSFFLPSFPFSPFLTFLPPISLHSRLFSYIWIFFSIFNIQMSLVSYISFSSIFHPVFFPPSTIWVNFFMVLSYCCACVITNAVQGEVK